MTEPEPVTVTVHYLRSHEVGSEPYLLLTGYCVTFLGTNGEAKMDEKLREMLDGMKAALSEGEKARFRDFWQMKKVCLELFKEGMHPTKRALYWNEYTALLKDAHDLQRILDEQMQFQIDQIALAIDSLEKEIEERDERISEMSVERHLKGPLLLMRKQIAFYSLCQEKILSLRKEILEMEMRVSQKNKMLAKLSQLGDIVFPEKKRLVPEFSKAFVHEIERQMPLRKDKIKEYQGLLKTLPLASEAYRSLRKQLSDAWEVSDAQEKQKREETTRVQKEERGKAERVAKAIQALEGLAQKAHAMEWENIQEEYHLHRQAFEAGEPTKRELIAFKHYSLIIREAEEEQGILRGELEELIGLMRKEMNHCGLDIEFAMKLKELISVNREKLEKF